MSLTPACPSCGSPVGAHPIGPSFHNRGVCISLDSRNHSERFVCKNRLVVRRASAAIPTSSTGLDRIPQIRKYGIS